MNECFLDSNSVSLAAFSSSFLAVGTKDAELKKVYVDKINNLCTRFTITGCCEEGFVCLFGKGFRLWRMSVCLFSRGKNSSLDLEDLETGTLHSFKVMESDVFLTILIFYSDTLK